MKWLGKMHVWMLWSGYAQLLPISLFYILLLFMCALVPICALSAEVLGKKTKQKSVSLKP